MNPYTPPQEAVDAVVREEAHEPKTVLVLTGALLGGLAALNLGGSLFELARCLSLGLLAGYAVARAESSFGSSSSPGSASRAVRPRTMLSEYSAYLLILFASASAALVLGAAIRQRVFAVVINDGLVNRCSALLGLLAGLSAAAACRTIGRHHFARCVNVGIVVLILGCLAAMSILGRVVYH